jgi:hypothetical protein
VSCVFVGHGHVSTTRLLKPFQLLDRAGLTSNVVASPRGEIDLRTTYGVQSRAITVPYGPIYGKIRRNSGFTDLRGRPDHAANIVEGKESAALRNLLVRLAYPDSPLFSIGCDLGSHEEKRAPPKRRLVAGGYIQLAGSDYKGTSADAYLKVAKSVEASVSTNVDHNSGWELMFVLQPVEFRFEPTEPTLCSSLSVWFFAGSKDLTNATASRELLIEALVLALRGPATYPR